MTHYKQKTEIFIVTRPPACWKPDPCFWFVRKDKENKSEFVTKWAKIIATIIFMQKYLSNIY